MTAQIIKITEIDASNRRRPVDPLVVEAYAAIAEQRVEGGMTPLIQPIIVRPDGDFYRLTAGANRLSALIAIGHTELTVGDDVIIRAEDDAAAADSELFENLANAGLTALDRCIFLAEAKERADAKRGEARGRKRKDQQFKDDKIMAESAIISSERFTKAAANRLGMSEVVIKDAVRIAKALDPQAVAEIRGTMVADNSQELKALAELSPDNQRKAASSIKSAASKTVAQARVAIGLDKPKTDDPQARIYANLTDLWTKASKVTRAQFMADFGLVDASK